MRPRGLVLALLVLGCSADPPSGPPPGPSEPAPSEVAPSETAPSETAPSERDPAALRGPRGRGPVDCSGRPDDPASIALFQEEATHGDLGSAIRGLEALAGEHPASATARVRLGELLLRTQPPRAADASRWFDRALALHAEGCELAPRDHWAALEGAGLSRMMQGDYAGALPHLRDSLQRWPAARASRYNLACALCQTGDTEGCESELGRVLQDASPPPDFLANQARTRAQYVDMARRDPDLAPLREDSARFDGILAGPTAAAP